MQGKFDLGEWLNAFTLFWFTDFFKFHMDSTINMILISKIVEYLVKEEKLFSARAAE